MRRRPAVAAAVVVALAAFLVTGGLALRAALDAEEPAWRYRQPLG